MPENRSIYGTSLLCTLICLSASFSIVRNVTEWQIKGRWIGLSVVLSVLLVLFLIRLIVRPEHPVSVDVQTYSISMCIANITVVLYCLLQAVGMVKNYSSFCTIADYDNPAGVAALLCVTFPFACESLRSIKTSRIITCILLMADVFIMSLIQSRTGLLAMAVMVIVWLASNMDKGQVQRRLKIVMMAFLCATIIVLCILFTIKKASTSGRFVILKISWKMITDNPWFGHGLHGFAREYMLYQADYFRNIGDQGLAILADNVTHPLSEFVLLMVNFGLIGLSAIFVLLFFSFKWAWNSLHRDLTVMLLAGITVLSLFSYPFRYPMTFLSLCFCLLGNAIGSLNVIPVILKRISSGIIMVAVMLLWLLLFLPWYKSQVLWADAVKMIDMDLKAASMVQKDMLPRIDPVLKVNPRYLYSRAVINYYANDYEAALDNAKKSSIEISCYDTELLLGNLYQKIGQNKNAEFHYRQASFMCPSHITPLFSLFRLYEEERDTIRMIETGQEILEKPVKIQSHDTRAMRFEVHRKIMGL